MQSKNTMLKYLTEKRLELLNSLSYTKTKIMSGDYTEKDTEEVLTNQARLDIIEQVIKICEDRNRY